MNKKKKKSFLSKARKFGQRGNFGKGASIEKEDYDYFVNILEQLNKAEFEDDDDKKMFVENVFEATNGKEVLFSSNQLASR